MVVDHDAVVGQQLGRDRAHARRRRDGQRDVHVLDDGGGRAAQRALLAGGDRGGGRLGGGRGRAWPRRACSAAGPGAAGAGSARPVGPRQRCGSRAGACSAPCAPSRRPCGRRRRPGCPAGSRRRTRARPGPRWTDRRGTAGTSPRPATRWCRIPPRGRAARRTGMSSRLTRGGVPSSSLACGWAVTARLDRVSSLRPYAVRTGAPGCAGGIGTSAGYSWRRGRRAARRGRRGRRRPASLRRCRAAATWLMSRALAPSWSSRSRRPRRRAAPGRSRASPPVRGDRRVQRGAAGGRIAPVHVGARLQQEAHQRQPAAARGEVQRAGVGVGAALQEQLRRRLPRRRRRPRTTGRRRWSGRRASAPSSRWRVSCVDVPQVGGARRVHLRHRARAGAARARGAAAARRAAASG